MQAIFASKGTLTINLQWKEYDDLDGILLDYITSSYNPFRVELAKKLRAEASRAIMVDSELPEELR